MLVNAHRSRILTRRASNVADKWCRLTLGLNLESGADQSEQGGIKHDCPVTVEGHVHRHQALQQDADRGVLNVDVTESCSLFSIPQSGGQIQRAVHVFVKTHLTGHSVRTKLAKAQWGLDPPQQGHHIEVLYPTPGDHTHSQKKQHAIRSSRREGTRTHFLIQYRLLDTYLASGSYSDQILLNSSR